MILTREEYEQIVRQKAKAESEAAAAKKNAAAAIEQADRDAQRKIREAEEEKEKDRICQALSEAEIKIEYWRDLNENLLRISKERANADRNLKPKKEHTGYVVVSSTEKEYRYKVLLYEAAISLIARNTEFKEIHRYYQTRGKNSLKKMQIGRAHV